MKKYILTILFLGLMLVLPTSCLKEYLDKAPESGLTEQEVFSKYENYWQFWKAVYDGRKYFSEGWRDYSYKNGIPMYFDMWDQKYTWEGLTDCSDGGRYMEGHTLKAGAVIGFVNKFTYDGKRRPILESMFTIIRISNKCLENFHLLEETILAEDDPDTLLLFDLEGQAHFMRAFAHFELFRIWGPMPYITQVLDEGDQFDMARLSKVETCQKIAADFDTAATFFLRAKKMRRDASGSLDDTWQAYPSGVAALGYKARALLYAASPLNNETNDVTLWQTAAQANWDAIQKALNPGTGISAYALLTIANRTQLYYGKKYTNETIWGYNFGSQSYNWGNFQGITNGIFGNSTSSWSGVCPTQNWVDKYETKWCEPLNTAADRAAAIAAGHYKDQDPYANRDPRLAIDIIFNQGTKITGWTDNKAQIYYTVQSDGSVIYSELLDRNYLGRTFTGYYERKRWPGFSIKNSTSKYDISTPMMRLSELYLNYAEASNEAYGPTGIGVTGGTPISALDAINLIRKRANGNVAWNVLPAYTGSTDAFRPRIRNERNIELSFEGHYYFDLRRWKDAPLAYSSTLYGVDIEKLPAATTTYPTGFKYTRLPLAKDRQPNWKDAMYYLPFNVEDMYKMKNFVPNVPW